MYNNVNDPRFVILIGTQTSGIELSLDDLHQNALWVPQSSLQNLKEIGKGM